MRRSLTHLFVYFLLTVLSLQLAHARQSCCHKPNDECSATCPSADQAPDLKNVHVMDLNSDDFNSCQDPNDEAAGQDSSPSSDHVDDDFDAEDFFESFTKHMNLQDYSLTEDDDVGHSDHQGSYSEGDAAYEDPYSDDSVSEDEVLRDWSQSLMSSDLDFSHDEV